MTAAAVRARKVSSHVKKQCSSNLSAYLTISASAMGFQTANAEVRVWNGTPITVGTNKSVYWDLNAMTAGSTNSGSSLPTGSFGIFYNSTNYVYSLTNSLNIGWSWSGGAQAPFARLGAGTTIEGTPTGFNWLTNFTYFSKTSWNTYDSSRPWATRSNGTQGYIGFYRNVGPDFYYGWAQFTYNNGDLHTLTLENFAWNDTPNQAITTTAVPEPSSLGLLALGAAGLACLRARRRAD